MNVNLKSRIFLNQNEFIGLLHDFINDSFSGRRLRSDGKKIKIATVDFYINLNKLLEEFSIKKKFELRIYVFNNLTPNQREKATKWYMNFYREFTNYLYDDKNLFDNYVGSIIKTLRTFFKYLQNERQISFGDYSRYFYVANEEIQIIALRPAQLGYIIHSNELNNKLSDKLKEIRDIFVFGCTVALRVSDLLTLNKKNLVIINKNYYLNVKSEKTKTKTLIKLPPYAVDIILRYDDKYASLLPPISIAWLDKLLKDFASFLPDNFELQKIREQRGQAIVIYKNKELKTHYHLSDHISSHTMRRTAITTMLMLGMSEHLVRKISGHAANSSEFFRYVELSQSFIDEETDKIFDKINQLNVA